MFSRTIQKNETIIKRAAILLIKIYQIAISPFLGNRCRFYPNCSLYARIAIERYGVYYGVWLTFKRLLRCHPWYNGDGYDPVPELLNYEKQRIERIC